MSVRVSLLALAALLSACASPQQVVSNREDLLDAAGFTAQPANTPARQAMLRNLPPDRFVRRARGSQFVYIFADPLVCACVYFGNEAAFGRYRQEVLNRQIVNDQMLAAQLNQDAAWDWGPWGPFGPGPYGPPF